MKIQFRVHYGETPVLEEHNLLKNNIILKLVIEGEIQSLHDGITTLQVIL